MAEMWVDPGRLGETARTVSAIGDVIADARAGTESAATGTGLLGSRVGRVCGAGSRAVSDVLAVVAGRLHDWSASTARAAGGYARTDTAEADSLVGLVAGLRGSDGGR